MNYNCPKKDERNVCCLKLTQLNHRGSRKHSKALGRWWKTGAIGGLMQGLLVSLPDRTVLLCDVSSASLCYLSLPSLQVLLIECRVVQVLPDFPPPSSICPTFSFTFCSFSPIMVIGHQNQPLVRMEKRIIDQAYTRLRTLVKLKNTPQKHAQYIPLGYTHNAHKHTK